MSTQYTGDPTNLKKSPLHIGMRNFKTALAVFVTLVLYTFIPRDGAYLACTSAIICMASSVEKSISDGISRLVGTVMGGTLGYLFFTVSLLMPGHHVTILLATVGTSVMILICNLLRRRDATILSVFIFLIIVLHQSGAVSPLVYTLNRMLDTGIGIALSVVINRFIRNPSPKAENADRGNIYFKYKFKGTRNAGMYKDMMDTIGFVAGYDKEVGQAMDAELARQRRNLELIASENLVTPAVMAAMGTALTNKYAEGYPGKRYYGGCECVDVVENLAIERAKKLFGCNFANVQPHSGSQANQAVYHALINNGDTVLGMSLSEGGHLTHGSPVNFSGINYKFVSYGVDSVTHRIDLEEVRRIAMECKPKMIVAGASAYPREIDFKAFSEIARECGAYFFVDMAHIAGLVAAGLHMSPIPYADVTSTTTHKTLRGPRGGMILCNDEEIAKKINKAIFPGCQGGPLIHTIAAKAVCFGEALQPSFVDYQKKIVSNMKALADALKDKGFELVSGGTDNHLGLVDLRGMNITGKELEKRLDEVYITVNKNSIPNEPQSPFVTSGIRVGTAAVTTRGLDEADMKVIADCMYRAATDFEGQAESIRADVDALCAKYPLYQ